VEVPRVGEIQQSCKLDGAGVSPGAKAGADFAGCENIHAAHLAEARRSGTQGQLGLCYSLDMGSSEKHLSLLEGATTTL
jgi:hypothetical protein